MIALLAHELHHAREVARHAEIVALPAMTAVSASLESSYLRFSAVFTPWQADPTSVETTMSGFFPRRSNACSLPLGTTTSDPGRTAAASSPMRKEPSPATT